MHVLPGGDVVHDVFGHLEATRGHISQADLIKGEEPGQGVDSPAMLQVADQSDLKVHHDQA